MHVVKGLAALAPVFRHYEVSSVAINISGGVDGMLKEIMKSADHYVRSQLGNNEEDRNSGVLFYSTKLLERKADFLLAIASILMASSVTITAELLEFVTTYATDLIVGYSRLWLKTRKIIHNSINCVLAALVHSKFRLGTDVMECERAVDVLISTILARTVSRLIPGETPEMSPFDPISGELDDRLYSVYLPLWESIFENREDLLNDSENIDKNGMETGLEQSQFHVYDSLMKCIQRYFIDCDLRYDESTPAPDSEFIGDQLIPHNAADQELLLNLVSFLETFLPRRIFFSRFQTTWLPIFAPIIIERSTELPAVSALYRVLLVFLRSCNVNDISDDLKGAIKLFCSRLIGEVSSFQQELLLAALRFVLSTAAVRMVGFQLISAAIKISLGGNILIESCINAMEMFLGTPELISELEFILPLLDKHLVGVASTGTESSSKIIVSANTAVPVLDRGDSVETQRIILRFLGRLGGYNKLILNDPSRASAESIAWTADGKTVRYNLPVQAGSDSLCLYFDKIIPRVIELCSQVS